MPNYRDSHSGNSFPDRFCLAVDQVVRTLFGQPKTTNRDYPVKNQKEAPLSSEQRKHSAKLMRINHAGEVCAQALYLGQAIFAHDKNVAVKMQQAANEEGDHLVWCAKRIEELGDHVSYLNPFWFMGSFMIGTMAALAGDQWSLGFLAETEKQVVAHLEKHLQLLAQEDKRSFTILQQMQFDEASHQQEAMQAGAKQLPTFVKSLMGFTSQIMVKMTYLI